MKKNKIKTIQQSQSEEEKAKPRRLNVSNPRAAFMGAFVEAQPGTTTQAANSRPLESPHSTNSLEISLNYTFV